jgi:hypothetical protein
MKVHVWLVRSLATWGALTLFAAFGLVSYMAYSFGPGNVARVDQASPSDVRFVLNWCGLGDERIESVVHSYLSPRSGPGGSDYLDAYAIKITHVDTGELTEAQGWYRGDRLPPILDGAASFVGSWLHEVPWYPTESDLRSPNYYVYPWLIETHGLDVASVQAIFVRAADNMVFYFGGST